eukprot:14709452-Alexandrium_andersonii.AAC.1
MAEVARRLVAEVRRGPPVHEDGDLDREKRDELCFGSPGSDPAGVDPGLGTSPLHVSWQASTSARCRGSWRRFRGAMGGQFQAC